MPRPALIKPTLIICEITGAGDPLRSVKPNASRQHGWAITKVSGGVDAHMIHVRKLLRDGWRGLLVFVLEQAGLSITQAWDWQEICAHARALNVEVSGFAENLDFAAVLALSAASMRGCPPLAGPVLLGVEITHMNITGLLSRFQIEVEHYQSPPLKPAALLVNQDGPPEVTLAMEQDYVDRVAGIAGEKIRERTGKNIPIGRIIATGSEFATLGILTAVGYEPAVPHPETLPRYKPRLPRRAAIQPRNNRLSRYIRPRKRNHNFLLTVRSSMIPGRSNIDEALLHLKNLPNEKGCTGLLLVVEVDGGELERADRFLTEIEKVKREFPVVAYLRLAVSAGYLLACGAQHIAVNPLARVGGAGATGFRFRGLGGVDSITVASGQSDGESRRINPDFTTALEQRVSLGAKLYAARVRQSRTLSADGEKALADGRIMGAQDCCSFGFADSIASLMEAFDQLSGLTGSDEFETPPGARSDMWQKTAIRLASAALRTGQ